MISLLPFEASDFDRFIAWIRSPEELQQFAGPYFSFPVTKDQLNAYSEDRKRSPYKIVHTLTKQVIGHCELSYEHDTPRLCRILIADESNRNKGYGKKTIHALLQLLFVEQKYTEADLNVYAWNVNAITCYESVGFRLTERGATSCIVGKEIWRGLQMRITKQDWLDNRS